MTQVIASAVLANGLRTEFSDTYTKIRNRQADSRLGIVMDNITATNRQHEFAYFNAAPHFGYWRRGDTIPGDAMDSVSFSAQVYEFGQRISWSKFDRKDDQTSSLFDAARMTGESAGLMAERFFFDLLTGDPDILPAVGTAPDGANFFATTAGGANRFGVSSGNLLSGYSVASVSQLLQAYYTAIKQFILFKDGKGQPLLSPETVASGVMIIHAADDLQIFEQAFNQVRQGVLGPDNGADAVTSVSVSNVVRDSSRNVQLWATPRLTTSGDWYMFLLNPPKKPTFLLDREGLQEFTSLEGDNNSDHTRSTAQEYVQWELRQGAAVALPYGAIKVTT